jgi:hypothetical protein
VNPIRGSHSSYARSTALLPFLVGVCLLHVSCAGSAPPASAPPNPYAIPKSPPVGAPAAATPTAGGVQASTRVPQGQNPAPVVANPKPSGIASGGAPAASKPPRAGRSPGSVPWQQSMPAPPSQPAPTTKLATADPIAPQTAKPPVEAPGPRATVSQPVVKPEEKKTPEPMIYETTKTIDRTESYTPKISGD